MNKANFFPTKVIRLENEDSGISHSIIRLPNTMIDSKKKDRNRFFRREALLVTNLDSKSSVIRFAMGSNALKGLTSDRIALDYDAIDSLGITFNSEVNLEVSRASRMAVYSWFYNHPDLLIQVTTRLAMFGAVMGVMGFIIGTLSLI